MGATGVVVVEQASERAAQDCQIGYHVGLATAGAVLAPYGVSTPMVPDFHSAPVVTDELDPSLVGALVGFLTGEVIAGFEAALPGSFDRSSALDGYQCARIGELDGGGFHRPEH